MERMKERETCWYGSGSLTQEIITRNSNMNNSSPITTLEGVRGVLSQSFVPKVCEYIYLMMYT